MALTHDEQYSEAVEQRTKELMAEGAEFDPLEKRNFGEAISGGFDCIYNFMQIADLARACRGEEAIDLMRHISTKYWLPRARRQAEVDLATEATEREEVMAGY